MKTFLAALIAAAAIVAASCQTIGVSKEKGGYALISPPVAHAMIIDNRGVVIIDFRTEEAYHNAPGHIAGALSVPLDIIETRLAELVPYSSTTVLVYASTEEEAISGARILSAAGLRNVVVIQGGIDRWIELGYKTVTSG